MAIRKNIYYWKSDRPHTAGNIRRNNQVDEVILESQLQRYLQGFFNSPDFVLQPAGGQGNHITYTVGHHNTTYFIRLENGPERDDYMDVESGILSRLKELNIPCPGIFLSDSTRQKVPFAIQVMEFMSYPNMDTLKISEQGLLALAESIGAHIAKWQTIKTEKFGLFNTEKHRLHNLLCGYHDSYAGYFFLNLEKHLSFLSSSRFLEEVKVQEIREIFEANRHLLDIEQGCLVHKDIAFWNILADEKNIKAFIDWDDAISGDPVDDLSLLGCFYSGNIILKAIEGYKKHCIAFPENFDQRFWLHLLRNMVFKSVIRVRGKYFDIKDNFFLLNPDTANLRLFTLDRIDSACQGLKGNKKIEDL